MMLAISNTSLGVAVTALFLGTEYTLFALIPDSYAIAVLRFVNIFAMISYNRIYMRYLNINISSYPVNGSTLTTYMIPTALVIFAAGSIIIHHRKNHFLLLTHYLNCMTECLYSEPGLLTASGCFSQNFIKSYGYRKASSLFLCFYYGQYLFHLILQSIDQSMMEP